MLLPSRYWKIKIIDAPIVQQNKLIGGYKVRNINQAKEFFKITFPHIFSKSTLSPKENRYIQTALWEKFYSSVDIYQRAFAGLCLRCYISQTILVICKTIAHTYKTGVEELLFTYLDLLPFVLNDDGKSLVIFNSILQKQQILKNDTTTHTIAKEGEFFSIEILRKFNPHLNSSESLDNWTWRLTKQNKNLTLFLWEFGIQTPTDWGLLCRDIPRSLKVHLKQGDYEIIEVFHAVYRRDRRNANAKGSCCKPTINQLQEMMFFLQQRNIIINSYQELLNYLQRIAEILRQDKIYQKIGILKTVPTEVYDKSINGYVLNQELPYYTDPEPEEIELQQLQYICNALFEQVLYQAIANVVFLHFESLKTSKGYKRFAQNFYQGLLLYYQDNLSLGEIAKLWEIPGCKARRIFKLENLVDNIQHHTEQKFIGEISKTLTKTGLLTRLTQTYENSENFKNMTGEIRDYALNKTFLEARAEIQSGKKKSKKSLFAKLLCRYLHTVIENAA
jgi:predicted DNA-binding protein YlxM (UPF0122 family)